MPLNADAVEDLVRSERAIPPATEVEIDTVSLDGYDALLSGAEFGPSGFVPAGQEVMA